MSDTEFINFDGPTRHRGSVITSQRKEHKDILAKLEIPDLVDFEIAQALRTGASESTNEILEQLDEAACSAQGFLESIKSDNFSRDPDFLGPQIVEAEKKLEEVSKDLWVKLELTGYEDPANYYEMIKTAESVFRRDLRHLIKKEKAIKSKELSNDLKELYVNKANIEEKLLEIYKWKA